MAHEFDTYDEEYEYLYGGSVMDCPYCKGKLTMFYENNAYFVCKQCHAMIDREVWFAETHGYSLEYEDEDGFDDDSLDE